MKKTIIAIFMIVILVFSQSLSVAESGLLTFDTPTERETVYERKITHKKTDADVFMASLDDVMKEELVRSVIY